MNCKLSIGLLILLAILFSINLGTFNKKLTREDMAGRVNKLFVT